MPIWLDEDVRYSIFAKTKRVNWIHRNGVDEWWDIVIQMVKCAKINVTLQISKLNICDKALTGYQILLFIYRCINKWIQFNPKNSKQLYLHRYVIMILGKICCELYICHKIFLRFAFIVFKHEDSMKMLKKRLDTNQNEARTV